MRSVGHNISGYKENSLLTQNEQLTSKKIDFWSLIGYFFIGLLVIGVLIVLAGNVSAANLIDNINGYYNFTGSSTTQQNHSIGSNGTNITVMNSMSWTGGSLAKCNAGSMIFLATGASNMSMTTPRNGSYSGQATIAAWLYLNGTDAYQGFGWGDFDTGKYPSFEIREHAGTKVQFIISKSSSAYKYVLTSTYLSNRTWYHVAFVTNGSSVNAYVNGVDQGAFTTGSGGAVTSDLTTSNFYFNHNESTTPGFRGMIDEVGIWNRALTSTEIGQLYNSGSCFEPTFYNYPVSPVTNTHSLYGVTYSQLYGITMSKIWGTV